MVRIRSDMPPGVLGPEFDDYEGEAVREDLKLGAQHPGGFERIAIVSTCAELNDTKRWAAADDDLG